MGTIWNSTIERYAELRSSKALPKVNRKRKARLYLKDFGSYADLIRQMPCLVCGRYPVDPHHVKSRGAGVTIELALPWEVLVHDNHRLSPRKHGKGLFQTTRYRNAKARARRLLVRQWQGPVSSGPIALVARFHLPDNIRRDVTNYGKLICDSLTGIVIEDDRWQVLRSTTWEAVGIDRGRPRVEITMTVIPSELDAVIDLFEPATEKGGH